MAVISGLSVSAERSHSRSSAWALSLPLMPPHRLLDFLTKKWDFPLRHIE